MKSIGKLFISMLSVGLITAYMTEVMGIVFSDVGLLVGFGFWVFVSTYGLVIAWLIKS